MFRFLTLFFFFAAWLILLLVSLSLPIINRIDLFGIWASTGDDFDFINSGAQGGVRFGLWGYCTSDITAEFVGFDQRVTPAECTDPALGYEIDDRLVELLQLDDFRDALNRALTFALVIHPIACGLAFLSLVLAAIVAFRPSKAISITTGVIATLTAILTTIVFIIDICIIAITEKNIEGISDNFSVGWGPMVWMVLAAAILVWLGTVSLCLSAFRARRNRKVETY